MKTLTIKELLEKYHTNQQDFKNAVLEIYDDVIDSDFISNEDVDEFFTRLIEPNRSLRFKVEWYDDENHLQVNRGYRIQFNNTLGPYKGGLRFHPEVKEDTFKFLGFEQIFKNALTGLPRGGAKGGADFNPKGKSPHEILRFCQAFMNELHKHIGAHLDIPAGDIGVGSREIGYLYGHYLKLTDQYTGVLTGKGYHFGGSCIREEATGYGATYLLESALNEHDKEIQGLRVLVSGAGNVALHAVEKLIHLNATVLSVSDSSGTLHFPKGIKEDDLNSLKELKFDKRESLSDFNSKQSEFYKNQKPWGISADCAFPCATQNELDLDDAKELVENGVWAFCEGANMPMTDEAVKYVMKNESLFLPGKAANAGGVAVSGIERTQNSLHKSFTAKEVDEELKEVMRNIHKNCVNNSGEKKNRFVNYKRGANLYSFKKIYETTRSLLL